MIGVMTLPSPSPRPSPQWRGRIVSQSFDESKRLVCSEVWMRGSLSQRERAGVRGNATSVESRVQTKAEVRA